MNNNITIEVNGIKYEGWTNIRVTKSIEDFCGSFSFVGTQTEKNTPFPIKNRQYCRIFINNIQVINGWIEKIIVSYSATGRDAGRHSISVSGRDRTNDIVDSTLNDISLTPSLTLESIIKKVLDKLNLQYIEVINPYNIKKIDENETTEMGISAYDFMHIYAQKRQIMLTTDNNGNIKFVRAGDELYNTILSTDGADPKTVKESSVTYDDTKRFRTYVIVDQYNNSTAVDFDIEPNPQRSSGISSIAVDNEIRKSRLYTFTSDDASGADTDTQGRVNWEANFRRGQSLIYKAVVQGFKPLNDDGIWLPNKLVKINDPECDITNTVMLITNIEYEQDVRRGSLTRLKFLTRDAFTTEVNKPIKTKKDSNEGDNLTDSGAPDFDVPANYK